MWCWRGRGWPTSTAGRGSATASLLYENKGRHGEGLWGLAGKWRLAGELRREGFDRAILLQNAFDAALLAWLARIPERIGYARDGRGPLLTRGLAVPRAGEIERHERFYYLEMLRRAGLIDHLPGSEEIRFDCASDAAEGGRAYWRDRGVNGERWVGLSPGGREQPRQTVAARAIRGGRAGAG